MTAKSCGTSLRTDPPTDRQTRRTDQTHVDAAVPPARNHSVAAFRYGRAGGGTLDRCHPMTKLVTGIIKEKRKKRTCDRENEQNWRRRDVTAARASYIFNKINCLTSTILFFRHVSLHGSHRKRQAGMLLSRRVERAPPRQLCACVVRNRRRRVARGVKGP